MRAAIYLKVISETTLIAYVPNLEVCPRGLYEIGGKLYVHTGQPKFIINAVDRNGDNELVRVDLIVEEYVPEPKRPAVSIGPA